MYCWLNEQLHRPADSQYVTLSFTETETGTGINDYTHLYLYSMHSFKNEIKMNA